MTIFYIDETGSNTGAATIDDPINVEGLTGLVFTAGDRIRFRSQQIHEVPGTIHMDNWIGAIDSPIIVDSWGDGRPYLQTTGSYHMFGPEGCQYVNFQNIDFGVSDTGKCAFVITGSFTDIMFYDCKAHSGGEFWHEAGTSGGNVYINNSEIEYQWRRAIRMETGVAYIKNSNIRYAGQDQNGNINWATSFGTALHLYGSGRAEVTDSRFYRNKRTFVGQNASGHSIIDRCIINALPNTGGNGVDHLTIYQQNGESTVRNSIIILTGLQVNYGIWSESNGTLNVYNNAIFQDTQNIGASAVVNLATMNFQNNLLVQRISTPTPIFNVGNGNFGHNWYDFEHSPLAYGRFNASQSWATYSGNEIMSNSGDSMISPTAEYDMNNWQLTGSPLLGAGTGLSTYFGIDGSPRSLTGSHDIGPWAWVVQHETQYQEGGYGRYGFAPV